MRAQQCRSWTNDKAGYIYLTPSKTITPAPDVEGEQDRDRVFGHRDDEVEAGHLGLDVSVFRAPRVVLEIFTKLRRDIEFIL